MVGKIIGGITFVGIIGIIGIILKLRSIRIQEQGLRHATRKYPFAMTVSSFSEKIVGNNWDRQRYVEQGFIRGDAAVTHNVSFCISNNSSDQTVNAFVDIICLVDHKLIDPIDGRELDYFRGKEPWVCSPGETVDRSVIVEDILSKAGFDFSRMHSKESEGWRDLLLFRVSTEYHDVKETQAEIDSTRHRDVELNRTSESWWQFEFQKEEISKLENPPPWYRAS